MDQLAILWASTYDCLTLPAQFTLSVCMLMNKNIESRASSHLLSSFTTVNSFNVIG